MIMRFLAKIPGINVHSFNFPDKVRNKVELAERVVRVLSFQQFSSNGATVCLLVFVIVVSGRIPVRTPLKQ